MKTYKIVLLMLITSISVEAQREEVYQKVFDTDRLTSLVLDIENSTLAIVNSEDGKIHFNYFLEFENYSKKEREAIAKKIIIQTKKEDNEITILAKSNREINKTNIKYVGPGSLFFEYDFKSSKKEVFHKSKDAIIQEIRFQKYTSKPLAFDGKRFKIKDKKGRLSNFRKKNMKIFKSTFVIKVPPHVSIRGNLKSSNLTIHHHLFNEVMFDLEKGSFKSKELRNNLNQITVNDGSFKAEGLFGGSYILNNIGKGLIGTVYNTSIVSEFSKIEIGEIREGTSIIDFNSTYWFYNWSEDFKKFDMQAEYSKVNLFRPNKSIGTPNNYILTTYGYNTVHSFEDGTTAEIPPNRKNEKTKMLLVGDQSLSLNKVKLDIINGIVKLYKRK